MRKLVFIRHGKPVETECHHSLWTITDADKERAKHIFQNKFTNYYCSTLQRAIDTAESIEPNEKWIKSKLFDEIEKPLEKDDIFKERVLLALQFLSSHNSHTIIACHSRFMTYAYFYLKDEPIGGFDFLDWFEH